ncbi:hypothetical protein LVO79_16700 [Roseivivax marinus]|uniref:hypothetical protein n=1 Tax=Roseivivax marinus TaxID=1379903 RepID=UPI001F045134|nr:hypothetical protein [Roseivivax marinus]UMA64619.1 hypothetical protein LVO79_16700 [Roseivivax marinus]
MTEQTPIQKMFHEWKAVHTEARTCPDEDSEATTEEMVRIEDAMLEVPSVTAADFAAKVIAYTSYGDFGFTGDGVDRIMREACELVGDQGKGLEDVRPGGVARHTEVIARRRLEQFAQWIGREDLPERLIDADGAPTDELMAFVRAEELCLDWLFLGDVKPLAMAYRKQHSAHALHAVTERVRLVAEQAGIEPVALETDDDGAVLLTGELMEFCERADADLGWLASGDVSKMLEAYRKREGQTKKFARKAARLSQAEQRALVFTLRLILEGGLKLDDAMQTYNRVVEEQRAA